MSTTGAGIDLDRIYSTIMLGTPSQEGEYLCFDEGPLTHSRRFS